MTQTQQTPGVRAAPASFDAGPALSTFDALSRGSRAPAWLTDGLHAAWGLPAETTVTLIVLSENVTFQVDVAARPSLVVRLGRPGYAEGGDHIRSELAWIDALRRDAGVNTPAPRRGVDGEFVQDIADSSGARWSAVAFEHVSGRILEDLPQFDDRFFEIGQVTAALHEHARSWRAPDWFQRFHWRTTDLVGPHARWGDWRGAVLTPAQLDVLERAEHGAMALLSESASAQAPHQFGLIHADLRPSNVMTDGSDLNIIDFDDCGQGFFLYDFGAALTFYEHRPVAPAMAAGWLDGYRSVLPLSRTDLDAAAALSMLRRLTMLGWATTHRSDALPEDLWKENLPGTLEVAGRFLRNPRWIVAG